MRAGERHRKVSPSEYLSIERIRPTVNEMKTNGNHGIAPTVKSWLPVQGRHSATLRVADLMHPNLGARLPGNILFTPEARAEAPATREFSPVVTETIGAERLPHRR